MNDRESTQRQQATSAKHPPQSTAATAAPIDEGGLRPPPGLSFWRRAWWWFDFIVLVKIARLRFIAILLVIGVVITQWDLLVAYYERWTRPASESSAAASDVEWFCPMHPSIVRDNPKDKCPICFMPLSKRMKGEVSEEALPDGVVNRVQLTPYRIVLAGIQTWSVDYVPLVKEISAVGTVEFNERAQKTVSSRVKGRIDALFANETGQMVNAGDVLASVYSPDLVISMQNLLQTKKGGNKQSLADVRTRLELLDISKDQIDEVLETGKANTHMKIRSPISGHVIRKYVREGQYIDEGTPLYEVVDLSTVWIESQLYEDDIPFLPIDDAHSSELVDEPEVIATTRTAPNEEFRGKLRFIYPHVDPRTRTLTVRFELKNPSYKLRPGSTANLKLRILPKDVHAIAHAAEEFDDAAKEQLTEDKVLAIPEAAIIDTGNQRIAYRETEPGTFEGVLVKLGPKMVNDEGVNFYPVLSGLLHGEKVVTSGSFLVDAETRLNPAAGSIYFGGSSGSKSGDSSTVRSTTPEDPETKIAAALAKLSPEDRALAESQRFCPILPTSRLGSMGTPIKLQLGGRDVFICCAGCEESAKEDIPETLRKLDDLKKQSAGVASSQGTPTTRKVDEHKIAAQLAKLSEKDRRQAEAQRFCPIRKESRLGSMGVPVKLSIEGRDVFLCCAGCKSKALKDPKGTLQEVDRLLKKAAESGTPPAEKSTKSLTPEEAQTEREIAAELAKLSPKDRALAIQQRFCAVESESRLGSMGPPTKITLNGETIFLCCEGCEEDARKDAAAIVERVRKQREANKQP